MNVIRVFAAIVLLLVLFSIPSFAQNPRALQRKLSAVAPVETVSIGKYSDKSTWHVTYEKGVTQGQRAAADGLIKAWRDQDWDAGEGQRTGSLAAAETLIARIDRLTALQHRLPSRSPWLQGIIDDLESDLARVLPQLISRDSESEEHPPSEVH